MEEYLTLDDLCNRLSMKKSYIYELTHQEKIPHIKVGRHLRFKWSSIMEWLDHHERSAETSSSFIKGERRNHA